MIGLQSRYSSDQDWSYALGHALRQANIPTLLMTLIQLTGDAHWLSDQYRCARIRGLDDNDSGDLPADVQQHIRDASHQALKAWRQGVRPALPNPSLEQLIAMIRHSVNEQVPESFGKMIAAGLGLDAEFDLGRTEQIAVPPGFQVLIIGAGVSGICTAIQLQAAGIPYVMIEKNADVGGTWHENRYPGAGVDTPSHLYAFSFAPHDWKMHFALQAEIRDYFQTVADRFGLRAQTRFHTQVESAQYDEARAAWQVVTLDAAGVRATVRANVVISGVGLLNVPKMPVIAGMERFAGKAFHTARWPDGIDVKGRKLAIIGNGATAMQIVPAILNDVRTLTVFQRSRQWAAPFDKFKMPISDDARFLLRELPFYHQWYRQRLAWIFNDRIHGTLQIDPEWPYPERSINKSNERHRTFFTGYIQDEVGGRADLLGKLVPDYPPFGKRMLMDNGWFRAMTRPHVDLVETHIREIDATGVVTVDGQHHDADIIAYATGFDAINMLSSLELRGRGGISIRDAWAQRGPEAYLGMAVPGFPNFFILHGPNTALGHGGSIVQVIETQVRYVISIIGTALQQHPHGFEVEVKEEIHRHFNARVQDLHGKMIWSHQGIKNWYRNETGRVVATTPFRNDTYWAMARETDIGAFTLRPAHAPLAAAS